VIADGEGEAVFKALADGNRRALLDALFDTDGQRLGELCEILPGITRFGVMKHLAVLQDAGLVVAEKVGREKFHYLNPVPIQQIHDRWMSKYAQPFSRTMTSLQRALELQSGGSGREERRSGRPERTSHTSRPPAAHALEQPA
jgi:DNA-binding transcriptional ArsR family regulator